MSPKDFINTFRPLVVPIAQRYNVPASVLLAQIAIESAWLKSTFSKNFYNLTGMKATGKPIPNIWNGSKSTQDTNEVINGQTIRIPQPFRVYDNYTQSIEDLAHRHAIRFKFNLNSVGNDINKFIDKVISTGYATGTGYFNLINSIIDKYKLYDLDKGAKFTKQTKTATGTTTAPTTSTTPPSVEKKKTALIIGASLVVIGTIIYITKE